MGQFHPFLRVTFNDNSFAPWDVYRCLALTTCFIYPLVIKCGNGKYPIRIYRTWVSLGTYFLNGFSFCFHCHVWLPEGSLHTHIYIYIYTYISNFPLGMRTPIWHVPHATIPNLPNSTIWGGRSYTPKIGLLGPPQPSRIEQSAGHLRLRSLIKFIMSTLD